MKRPTTMGWLRIACVLSLVGMALMTWSLFDPRPPPVLIALTFGQCVGTLSFVIFLRVMLRHYREGRRSLPPPTPRAPPEESSP